MFLKFKRMSCFDQLSKTDGRKCLHLKGETVNFYTNLRDKFLLISLLLFNQSNNYFSTKSSLYLVPFGFPLWFKKSELRVTERAPFPGPQTSQQSPSADTRFKAVTSVFDHLSTII